MADEPASTNSQAPKDMMGWLDHYLVQKAPIQLPEKAKEWIVKYNPWIIIVILVLLLPAVLLALGLSAFVFPFAGAAAPGLGVAVVALIAQVALLVAALPGLFARKKMGWMLLFYGDILNLVYSVLSGQIISGIISTIIGLYILFQVRSHYNK